jgi:small subunit ribosomal protein S20
MPVIKSAKKKLRKDKKLERINKLFKNRLAKSLKIARKEKSNDKIKSAIRLVDIAAKKRIIHKNKAARIKSSLAKLTVNKTSAKTKKKIVSKMG